MRSFFNIVVNRARFKQICSLLSIVSCLTSTSQNVGIGSSSFTPDSDAMLEVQSTTSGLLIPRMTEAQRTGISPTTNNDFGLLVYQTNNDSGFYYWNGAAWLHMLDEKTGWLTEGNNGINSGTNFLGTINDASLRFKTDNTEYMVLDSNGRVGIGTTEPITQLDLGSSGGGMLTLNPGTTTSINYTGYEHNHLIVGSYRDGSNYSHGFISHGYVTDPLRKFHIGTADKATFDGTTSFLEQLTITSGGNVGIGTTTPSRPLHVVAPISSVDAAAVFESNFATGAITNSPGINLVNTEGTDGNYSRIYFGDSPTGPAVTAIGAQITDHANNYGQLHFWTRGSSDEGNVRMAIEEDGNIGVGTVSPSGKFHVNNDDVGSDSSFVILHDGKVGIGTTTPTNGLLTLDGVDAKITLEPGDGGAWFEVWNDDSDDVLRLTHTSGNGIAVTGSGATGINVTAPLGRLHVNNDDIGGDSSFIVMTSGDVGIRNTNPSLGALEFGNYDEVNWIEPEAGVANGRSFITIPAGGTSPGRAEGPRIFNFYGTSTVDGHGLGVSSGITEYYSNWMHKWYERGNRASSAVDYTTRELMHLEFNKMGVGDSVPDAHLEVSANGTTGGFALLISSDDNTDGDLFAIHESGNTGIGTNNSVHKLTVLGSGDQVLISNTDGGSLATPALSQLKFGSLTNSYDLGNITAESYAANVLYSDLVFNVASNIVTPTYTEVMRMEGATGNVGIGTASPSVKLDVRDSSGGSTFDALQLLNSASNTAGTKTRISMPVFNGTSGLFIESVGNSVDGYAGHIYTGQISSDLYLGAGNGAAKDLTILDNGLVGIGTTTPLSTLDVAGSFGVPISTQTANYTATGTDHTIIGNPTGGTITITLPTAAFSTGRVYVIKNIHATNNVIIDGNASETIDGATTQTISTQYDTWVIQCDGTTWHKIN